MNKNISTDIIKLSKVKKPFVLFETDEFLVFYKPPYWKMDTSRNYNINDRDEMMRVFRYNPPLHVYVGLYLQEYHNVTPDNDSYNVVQRYDIQTSGGIIVVKDNKLFMPFRKIISLKKDTIKIYLTLVNGFLKYKNGYIKKNIECTKSIPQFCKTIEGNSGRFALSYYSVVAEYVDKNDNKYSLVQIRIMTGVTHQIRVHMKSLGHPVVSDYKYLTDEELILNKDICKRVFLHNFYLSIKYKDRSYAVKIPPSNDLIESLKKLKRIKRYFHYMDIHSDLLKDNNFNKKFTIKKEKNICANKKECDN